MLSLRFSTCVSAHDHTSGLPLLKNHLHGGQHEDHLSGQVSQKHRPSLRVFLHSPHISPPGTNKPVMLYKVAAHHILSLPVPQGLLFLLPLNLQLRCSTSITGPGISCPPIALQRCGEDPSECDSTG
jgi:hypothetical protein